MRVLMRVGGAISREGAVVFPWAFQLGGKALAQSLGSLFGEEEAPEHRSCQVLMGTWDSGQVGIEEPG